MHVHASGTGTSENINTLVNPNINTPFPATPPPTSFPPNTTQYRNITPLLAFRSCSQLLFELPVLAARKLHIL